MLWIPPGSPDPVRRADAAAPGGWTAPLMPARNSWSVVGTCLPLNGIVLLRRSPSWPCGKAAEAATGGARGVFEGDALLRRVGVGHRAEGTAAGFNRKGKGMPGHPLFRTIARTDGILDVRHRPGHIHDPDGADIFTDLRMGRVRPCLPCAKVEPRIDGAFPNETIVQRLHSSAAA